MYKRKSLTITFPKGRRAPCPVRQAQLCGSRHPIPTILRLFPTEYLRHRYKVQYGISSRSCGHPSWAPRHVFIAEPSEAYGAYARYVQMNAPEISAKCSCPQGKDCMPNTCQLGHMADPPPLTAAYLSHPDQSAREISLSPRTASRYPPPPKNEPFTTVQVCSGLTYSLRHTYRRIRRRVGR